MKINFALSAILLLSICVTVAGQDRIECTVTNPLSSLRENEPVVIRLADVRKELPGYVGGYVSVYDGSIEICSQQDDFDGDGLWDELVFLTDLRPKEKKTFVLHVNAAGNGKPLECIKEVNAQMFFNNPDKSITLTLEASSTADNMYDKMYHHGPAWESDKIGYRLYFDKKTTVDVYGKKKYRLELADTKWYPTDQQLADKYGDDILWVGNSVGVGTLKGWDGETATHIDPMSKRTARIVINGNLRTVVDMAVEGWQYQGQSIDVTVRYIQYARHRDMIAQVIIGEPAARRNLNFCTGVQKVRQSQTYSDKDGLIALWGTEYPTPDSVKYTRETFGLGVVVPKKNIEKFASDPLNHLIIIKNNKQSVIEYYVAAASQKEEAGYKTAGEFFAYMQDLKQIAHHPVKVKLIRKTNDRR
jgi:hypothetical protein